jgi:hypothetical protein
MARDVIVTQSPRKPFKVACGERRWGAILLKATPREAVTIVPYVLRGTELAIFFAYACAQEEYAVKAYYS